MVGVESPKLNDPALMHDSGWDLFACTYHHYAGHRDKLLKQEDRP